MSVLMPAPHSQQHTSFIRNYLDSGKAKVLNSTRELQALHKDRFVFPVKLALTKIAQGGEACCSVSSVDLSRCTGRLVLLLLMAGTAA